MPKGREDFDLFEELGIDPTQLKITPPAQTRQAVRNAGPVKLSLPRPHLSISQVQMYLRCAKQYEFRYVRDDKRPPGVAMALGTSGHDALEMTHHHIVDHERPADTSDVLDRFSDKWDQVIEAVADWEDQDPGALKDKGVALVRLYNENRAPNVQPHVSDAGIRGIEKQFRIDVAGVPMLGFIDLIDTNSAVALNAVMSEQERAMYVAEGRDVAKLFTTEIVDFKFKAKSMAQGEADGSLQLTLYSLATGVYAVRFEQLLKTKVPKIKAVGSRRTKHDHLWLAQVVREVADAISRGAFPPTDPTNWVCSERWCGYWHQCRGKKV